MIFGKDLAKLVARGRKTQTRRPLQRPPRSDYIVRRNGSRRRRPPAKVIQVDGVLYRACRYKAGQTYSVQPGRGKRGEHRIVVTDVHRERAGDIDYTAARAEGFRTTDEFKIAWVRIHDAAWIKREEIDRYADELDAFGDGDPTAVSVTDWILLERFRQRHAHALVWVITFELVRDVPRLLAPAGDAEGEDTDVPGARAAVPGGYTVQPSRALTERRSEAGHPSFGGPPHTDAPLCTCRVCRAAPPPPGNDVSVPEPEPVDDATLARFAADAAERRAGDPGRRLEDLRQQARSLARRLRQESDAGVKSGLDVISDLQQIEEQIRMLERNRHAA